ncbi:PepSY domain-containing protein [Nocardia thraciensis]
MLGRQLLVGGAVVGCGVLGLAACGDDNGTSSEKKDSGSGTSVSTAAAPGRSGAPGTPPSGDTAVAAALAALRTATGAVPDGKPFDLETEISGADTVFDVKVASNGNEFKVLIDSSGRQVQSQQQADKPSDDIAKLNTATITAEQALQSTGSRAPDARFDEMEIDAAAEGTVIWQIQLATGDNNSTTYTVDATTGRLSGP